MKKTITLYRDTDTDRIMSYEDIKSGYEDMRKEYEMDGDYYPFESVQELIDFHVDCGDLVTITAELEEGMTEKLSTIAFTDCESEEEENAYFAEVENILMSMYGDYDCIVRINYVDIGHENMPTEYVPLYMRDVMDLLEIACDIKNGVQFYKNEIGHVVMFSEGGAYTYNGKYYTTKKSLELIPYSGQMDIEDYIETL